MCRDLSNNDLSALPLGIFDPLTALRDMYALVDFLSSNG